MDDDIHTGYHVFGNGGSGKSKILDFGIEYGLGKKNLRANRKIGVKFIIQYSEITGIVLTIGIKYAIIIINTKSNFILVFILYIKPK
jgi:hypothetical protein